MKLKNIFNTLSLAAVALVATACQDTDAQIDITPVDAPQFIEAALTVEKPVYFGETTIKVTFDKNIGFASKNASMITINDEPADRALVIGVSNQLTIVKTLDFCNAINVHIPAGLVVGPQHLTYDEDIDVNFQTSDLPDNLAMTMTRTLGWGWNLGNHFDTSNTQWGYWDGATPTPSLFSKLALNGAKTVRIPATWTNHMDGSHNIDANYLNEVAGVVDMALAAGLNVILNTHHDSFETNLGNAASNADEYAKDSTIIVSLWGQVANRFANYPDNLIFETFNEIHAGDNWGGGSEAEYDLLNKWNQWAVDAIRSVPGNSSRWIGVSGYAANIDLTIDHLVLPEDPSKHLMVGVHCYDPYNFTLHPYADDGSPLYSPQWGHSKDGEGAEELHIITQFAKLRSKYIDNNIPCYLGEYGCVWKNSDYENAYRAYYLEFVCRTAHMAGLPMLVWDNNAKNSGNEANGFIDHTTGDWLNDSETMVPTMIKACTDNNSSYTLKTVWDKSPNTFSVQ